MLTCFHSKPNVKNGCFQDNQDAGGQELNISNYSFSLETEKGSGVNGAGFFVWFVFH